MKSFITENGVQVIRLITGRSNVFLVRSGECTIMVDTSIGAVFGTIKRKLSALGVGQIDYLLLTHAHFDHAYNADKIRNMYGAKVLIHINEADYLQTGENVPISGTNGFTRILTWLLSRPALKIKSYPACVPDIIIDNEFQFETGGAPIRVISTPGHTQGSVTLIADNEIAIAGDAIFGIFPGSVMPPFALDKLKLVKSWKILLETGCRLFMPSHGFSRDRTLLEKGINKYSKDPAPGRIQ